MIKQVHMLLVATVATLVLAPDFAAAQTTRKRTTTQRKAAATPRATPESRIPMAARRLKPSGAIAAFIVTKVQAGPAPGTGNRRSATATSDPQKFVKMFDRAIIYPRDVGARIVLNDKESGIDYVEIRGPGKGFGVNTADGKARLLVNNFKFPRLKNRQVTSGTAEVEIDAEFSLPSAPDKKTASRVKLTATFIEDLKNTRVFNVPDSELPPEEKKTIKSDTEAAAEPSSSDEKKEPAARKPD
jgi:hypothetical protein